MSRTADPIVPIPRFEELSPAFQARSRRGTARRGIAVNNSVHAFAHSEALGGATRDFFEAVATLTSLPNELRLLIRLAAATANQCRYCTAHQRHQLAVLGVSEPKMAAVWQPGRDELRQLAGLGVLERKMAAIWRPDGDELSPRERAAVRFAQAITIDAGRIPADVYTDFIAEFTPKERVEVAIVATAMGMLNKLNDGLRVPLEPEFEPPV